MPDFNEKTILRKLKQGDKIVFSYIFSKFYTDLVWFARTFTGDTNLSEDIVQEVFVKLWESRRDLPTIRSFKSYLLKTVQNRCLDWLRHMQAREKHNKAIFRNPILVVNDTEKYILTSELESAIKKAIDKLPKEFSEPFCMNRFEGLKYYEIADKMQLSHKTIEDRISKALKLLKILLKDYITLFWILWLFSNQ